MRQLLVCIALVLAAVPMAAHADTFTYTFSTLAPVDITVSFSEPTILTSETTIPSADLQSSVPGVINLDIDPVPVAPYRPSVSVEFSGLAFGNLFSEPLDTIGTFTSGDATLTITDVPSSVPEPSTIALLGTGALGLLGMAKRKFLLGRSEA